MQTNSLREDVIQFIEKNHTECDVCNDLYLTVTQSVFEFEDIKRISVDHHKSHNDVFINTS